MVTIFLAPAAEDIEVFHAEAEWIHFVMATGAFGLLAMELELGSQRQVFRLCLGFLECGNVRGRHFYSFAEEGFEDPATAEDRATR